MHFYAETQIDAEDQIMLQNIRRCFKSMPDIDLGIDENGQKIEMSCHVLARAVAEVFKLTFINGKFLNVFEHSWVKTHKNNIIDVYPIALISGPVLWDGNALLITRKIFTEINDIKNSNLLLVDKSFFMSVGKIVINLENIVRELRIHI